LPKALAQFLCEHGFDAIHTWITEKELVR